MNPLTKLIDECTEAVLKRQPKALHQAVFKCVDDIIAGMPGEEQLDTVRLAVYMCMERRLEERCDGSLEYEPDLVEGFVSAEHASFAEMGGVPTSRQFESFITKLDAPASAEDTEATPDGTA